MKLIPLMAAGFLAVASALTASAQTVIVFTGSTAFRSQTTAAIQAVLTPGYTFGYTGASVSSANAAIFVGSFSGNPVIIKTSWSGSSGGIQTVSATSPTKDVGVFPDNETTSAAGISGKADPRSGAVRARPDIAMGDSTQSTTKFNGTFLGVTYATLQNATITTLAPPAPSPVGIVPFNWVVSKSGPAGLNMTPQIAQALYTLNGIGAAPLALWTGLAADQGTIAYATGRDPDSGTRAITFAESGIGANSFVQQYTLTVGGGAITAMAFNAPTSINGVPVGAGESGESSGGTLAGKLGNTGPSAAVGPFGAGFCVGYLGLPDTATAVAAGGKTMTWNGVAYSENDVIQGRYTFWSYERLFYRPGTAGLVKTFADATATNIYNAVSTLNIFDMQVSRPTDGGLVTATYF
jgi:hypothetical protein